jgi:RNA polymerase sigma factor (sigma-70 family)
MELLEQRGEELYRLLYRLTLDEGASEELLQELFVRLFKSRRICSIDNLCAYARKVAVNLALDCYRKQKRSFVSINGLEEQFASKSNPGDEMIRREEVSELLDAVGRLKGNLRQVIVMHYIEQRSYEDIGQATGAGAHQVRAFCSRGIGKLRRMLSVESERSVRKETKDGTIG